MFSSVLHIILFLFISVDIQALSNLECQKQYFGEDSFVCVCDESACDNFPSVSTPSKGYYVTITSSRDKMRFKSETVPFAVNPSADSAFVKISVNSSEVFQTMIGFGGSFTDATGINVATLSKNLQDTFVRQYFSPDGLEYNIGRIPMAGCDFSTHPYSYDDVEGDVDLKYFNLTIEDYDYKIPLMKRAMEVGSRPLKLYGSPWSPPSWMKTNGMFNGSGGLIPEMQQPYANYFVKFVDWYKREGVPMWGLTAQNEPSNGAWDFWWNACHFTAEQQRDFVKDFLGPTLHAAGYNSLKLMIGDDSRYIYPDYIETELNDEDCASYVSGIGVHWYTDDFTPVSILDDLHAKFPDKFLLYTEASNGEYPTFENHVSLGSWKRGEKYASDIITNVNHWSAGWTDWNMALNMIGGPNWVSNHLDAPIIINTEENKYYKQPTFYVMGHFSKFVPENSKRVKTSVGKNDHIEAVSFVNPSGLAVIVILNKDKSEKVVTIQDSFKNSIVTKLPPKSIQTIIYNDGYQF